jgi:hypothetical protein
MTFEKKKKKKKKKKKRDLSLCISTLAPPISHTSQVHYMPKFQEKKRYECGKKRKINISK